VSFECMHKGKPAGKVFLSFLRTTTTTTVGMPSKKVPENLKHRPHEKTVLEDARTKPRVSTRRRLCNGGSAGFLIATSNKDIQWRDVQPSRDFPMNPTRLT